MRTQIRNERNTFHCNVPIRLSQTNIYHPYCRRLPSIVRLLLAKSAIVGTEKLSSIVFRLAGVSIHHVLLTPDGHTKMSVCDVFTIVHGMSLWHYNKVLYWDSLWMFNLFMYASWICCIDKFKFSSSCSIWQHVYQNWAPDAQFRYVAIATLFLLTSGLTIFCLRITSPRIPEQLDRVQIWRLWDFY